MTQRKGKLDTSALTLLKGACRVQIEMGLDEMLINPVTINRERMTLPKVTIVRKEVPQFASLEVHRQAICNCQNCPLGATRTKFVYGVGNPRAGVMFIGEAPGRDEDLKGEPFVGRAGQLLDKILAAIKFNREEVYIANILKCRPPNNRDPLPVEMETCLPYLKEQIRLIQPKLICALGRIAAQSLLNTNETLGRLRKKWHEFEGIPFLVTYHPAALLRFEQYKRDTWEDVQMLRARYDEITAGKV